MWHSVLNVKVIVGFQLGECSSRGILRDCENFAESSFEALVVVLVVVHDAAAGVVEVEVEWL